jgi:hypothetical protein
LEFSSVQRAAYWVQYSPLVLSHTGVQTGLSTHARLALQYLPVAHAGLQVAGLSPHVPLLQIWDAVQAGLQSFTQVPFDGSQYSVPAAQAGEQTLLSWHAKAESQYCVAVQAGAHATFLHAGPPPPHDANPAKPRAPTANTTAKANFLISFLLPRVV